MARQEIRQLIEKSIKQLQENKRLPVFNLDQIKIEHPEETNHGDYSTNIAMIIAKQIKQQPIEIAQLIVSEIKLNKSSFFDRIEPVEPGFINFHLADSVLINQLKIIIKKKQKYGSSKAGKNKTMVIDYSAPNIAKAFGIGHLRSTIIGQALYNIYKFSGWKCIGDNHLGDWGTQFGKLIVAIKKWGKINDFSVQGLENLYVQFHKQAEKQPDLEEQARKEFKNLENKEKTAQEIWQKCIKVSLKEFNKIYDLLNVKIDYALGESFYQSMLNKVVEEAVDKKVAQQSQGALVVNYPDQELPPAMILKSDQATNYFTRDLATIKYRLKKWQPDLIIYEVGADQKLHLKQVFKAAQLLGWVEINKFFHVAHGLVRTKTGKFSTRKGETVHLEKVLQEAIDKAKEITDQSLDNSFSEKEKQKIAKTIGIGAVKYNDLSQHYSKDIVFSWDKILNLKGNSAPYLQYTFARCQSVLKKAGFKINSKQLKEINLNDQEKEILRELYKFSEKIKESADKFSPNLICNFIFNLAQKYNLFYNSHPVIKASTKQSKNFRLAITFSVAQVLKNGLNLLGIEVPEKM
jgi:arginyl-tRNA synthetase